MTARNPLPNRLTSAKPKVVPKISIPKTTAASSKLEANKRPGTAAVGNQTTRATLSKTTFQIPAKKPMGTNKPEIIPKPYVRPGLAKAGA